MLFPDVLRNIILDYASEWELIDWVRDNEQQLNWDGLAHNVNAIDYMLKNPRDARWGQASANPAAFLILRDHLPMLIDWYYLVTSTNKLAVEYAIANLDKCINADCDHMLSRNPHAIDWLIAHPEHIDRGQLSANPAAMELLLKHPDDIDWTMLSINPSPLAIKLLDANPGKIWPFALSTNPNGLGLIKKYIDLSLPHVPMASISWSAICKMPDPGIVPYIDAYPNKINWCELSKNPEAFDYLKANKDNIVWRGLSHNPRIFELKQPDGVRELL